MSNIRGVFATLAALAVAVTALSVHAQRALTERHVSVRVVDDKGVPVQGLTAADFIVREDDLAREVVRVAPAPPPTHIALLVDNTAESQTVLLELRAALLSFVRRMAALDAPPAMTLWTFAERPTRLVDFTTSDIALESGIKRIIPRPSSGSYMLDAVVEASAALDRAGATRPAIVTFFMDAGPEFSNRLHTGVADALRDANASLWAVELQQSAPPQSQDARERLRVANDVTGWSGGMNRPILSRQGIEGAFADVGTAILSRYDVIYGRPASLVPPSRLSVELRTRSARLTAPRWTSE
jgi:hypothetical protein